MEVDALSPSGPTHCLPRSLPLSLPHSLPHSLPLSLPNLTLHHDETSEDFKTLVKTVGPDWKEEETEVKRLKGGTTNALFLVESGAEILKKEKLLIRINGAGSDTFINRQQEVDNLDLLHRWGLSEPVVAVFANGLVYKYVEGRTLEAEDLKLAKLHQVKSPEKPSPVIWAWISCFIDAIPDEMLTNKDTIPAKHRLRREAQGLRQEAERICRSDSVVFCHNDLACGNIIYDDQRPNSLSQHLNAEQLKESHAQLREVRFIDYEYSGWNYIAFDIANHFTEFVGGWTDEGNEDEADRGDGARASHSPAVDKQQPSRQPRRSLLDFSLCPTKQQKRLWLDFYLKCENALITGNAECHTSETEMERLGKEVEVMEIEVEKLEKEVEVMEKVSHLFWCVWALNQAHVSTIGASFVMYAEERYEQFKKGGIGER